MVSIVVSPVFAVPRWGFSSSSIYLAKLVPKKPRPQLRPGSSSHRVRGNVGGGACAVGEPVLCISVRKGFGNQDVPVVCSRSADAPRCLHDSRPMVDDVSLATNIVQRVLKGPSNRRAAFVLCGTCIPNINIS